MRRTTCEWALMGVLAVAMAVSASGCFKGEFANCKVTCATSADCPGSLECNPQGVCSPGGNMCSAMPDADLSKPQPLTVQKMGDGAVTSAPAGIDCGSSCMAEFPPLSSVTLTAAPAGSSVFDGWTGDCAGQTETCTLTMDGPKSTTAKFATHGALRWVKPISFSGQEVVSEIAVDANGDVVAAGMINDQGANLLYAVKYAKDTGEILWEKKTTITNGYYAVGGLDTDSAGNVYMCARFQGDGNPQMITTKTGTATVTGDLFGNVLAIRYDGATGAIDWAKTYGGSSQEECDGLVVSGTDFYIAGGTSSNPSNFDGVTLIGSTNYAYIVRAATSNGTAQQGRILAGTFDVFDLAENNGQIALAGAFQFGAPGFNIDSCNLSSTQTGRDGMIMNWSNNLVCTWSKGFGSLTANEQTFTYSVAPFPGGGWAITGSFQGSVNIAGSGSGLANQGMTDAFVARFAANGTHMWSFGYGGTGGDIGRGVDVTPTGEVVFSGTFANTVQFGSFPLTSTNNDLFITRLSSGATPVNQWAIKLGGTAYENPESLKVNAQGTVNMLASWTGMTDVAGTPLSAQDYDAWVGSFVR